MLKQRELDLGITREYYKEVKKFFDEKLVVPEEECKYCDVVYISVEKIEPNTYDEFREAAILYSSIREFEKNEYIIHVGCRESSEIEIESYENYEWGLQSGWEEKDQLWSKDIQTKLIQKKEVLPKIKREMIGDFKFEDEFTQTAAENFAKMDTELRPEDLGGIGEFLLEDIEKLKEQLEEAMKKEGEYFKMKMLVGDYEENIDMSKIIVL